MAESCSSSYVPSEANSSNIRVKLLDDLSKPFIGNDVYEMLSKNRGYCLIFANWSFDDPTLNVCGPRADSDSLGQVFKQLGFNVKLYPNLNKSKIESTLIKIRKSKIILSQHNAFVAIFLSHGQENGILARDSKVVYTDQITRNFTNKNCEGLIGKPKMFFISACRGKESDYGVSDGEETSDDTTAKDGKKRIPTWEDMIISYATVPGMVSRGSTEGTWFGSSLVTAIAEHAKDTDLDNILKIVQNVIREKLTSDYDPIDRCYKHVKQSTSSELRGWRKKLYFNPGYSQ